ncbi:2-oxo-4-hydroxy-4-carboxy-5-ureidoimidazoline decarboxylase [Alkalicoccobacillus porphyridii]|nr:2-oxo-4-hydroxy-4-carboxy-5-ureidoimidazoline decarboxylase [Alkalicoccobacillus porphyridii]
MVTLTELNGASDEAFVQTLSSIYEHSKWVAELAVEHRPYSSVSELRAKMKEIVDQSSVEQKKRLLLAHPNLGERIQMTDLSKQEQQNAGLTDLTSTEYDQFLRLNQTYMDTFGFPFIVAVKGMDKAAIYQQMQSRVKNSAEEEFSTAIEEVHKIAHIRLQALCS